MRTAWRSLLVCCLLLLLPLSVQAQVEIPGQPYQVYLPLVMGGSGDDPAQALRADTAFGMVQTSLTETARSGAAWTVLYLPWAAVEAQKGHYDWAAAAEVAAEIAQANALGLRVILTITATPEWARMVPGDGPHCGPVIPAEYGALARFAAAAALQYPEVQGLALYEGIDRDRSTENQLMGCWGEAGAAEASGQAYAALLSAVYPALKAVRPDLPLYLGRLELSTPEALDFLHGVLSVGGGQYFDGLGLSAYDHLVEFNLPWGQLFQYHNPDWGVDWLHGGPSVITKTLAVRRALYAYDLADAKIFVTGGLLCEGCARLDAALTMAQVDYLGQIYPAAMAEGLVLLWDGDGSPLAPTAALTYQFLSLELGTAQVTAPLTESDTGTAALSGYRFSRAENLIWSLWHRSGELEYVEVLLSPQPDLVLDLLGEPSLLLPELTVGPQPLLIYWYKEE